MRRLSTLDAQFLAGEGPGSNFGAQYCGLTLLRTGASPLTAERLRELVAPRVALTPPLRWRVVELPLGLGNPVFDEVEPDLDVHITESTLPAPAGERELADVVARIHGTRLDRDRPLWRMHLLHGMSGVTGLVITLHHAAADGISANQVLAGLVDGAPLAPRDAQVDAHAAGEPLPGTVRLLADSVARIPARLARIARTAPGTIAHLDQVPAIRGLPGVATVAELARGERDAERIVAPRTRFNVPLSPNRIVAWTSLSMADVLAVKTAAGLTVNDVIVALVGGALRRRLAVTADVPDLPLVGYLPVSVRTPDAANDFGNAITSIIAPLPTHLATPAERLEHVRVALPAAKARTAAAPDTIMADINAPIPPPLMPVATRGLLALIATSATTPPVNLILSNVNGFRGTLRLDGHELTANYPFSVIFDGFALNITAVSYRDQLDIGIVGDAAALPDAQELAADLAAELADLVRHTEGKSDDDDAL